MYAPFERFYDLYEYQCEYGAFLPLTAARHKSFTYTLTSKVCDDLGGNALFYACLPLDSYDRAVSHVSSITIFIKGCGVMCMPK